MERQIRSFAWAKVFQLKNNILIKKGNPLARCTYDHPALLAEITQDLLGKCSLSLVRKSESGCTGCIHLKLSCTQDTPKIFLRFSI